MNSWREEAVIKATAYILQECNNPLIRAEIAVPAIRPGEMLVKITAAGVCGSDVHMWRGRDPRVNMPIILGHEGVGIVVEMNGVKQTVDGEELRAGDTILWNRGLSCGKCYYCAVLHEPALCPARSVYGLTISYSEFPYLNGCYSEYIILRNGTDVFKIPDGVDPAVLVTASCSGATAAHAYDTARPNPGDTVLVQGPGPLGMFAVALAKFSGAKEIIAIGDTETRLGLCAEFGATRLLNRKNLSEKERREFILDLTHGRGVDYAVEAVGTPPALREVLNAVRPGGTIVSAGFGQPLGTIEFDGHFDLVRRNLHLHGIWVSSTRHTKQAMDLILSNQQLFGKMINKRFALTDVNEALQAMEDESAVKAVLIE